MKLKYDFAVREIVGEYVMVPLGEGAHKFAGMISTSETGATLVSALKNNVSRTELLSLLFEQFEIDEATASDDLDEFLMKLKKLDLLID